VVMAAVASAPITAVASPTSTDDPPALDCAGWLGDPDPGTAEWDQADLNNQRCASEGLRVNQANPAAAAATWANIRAGHWLYLGDPFRAPHRWEGRRGDYQLTSYTDRNGLKWSAALFGPRDADGGPHPGVVLACHACALLPTAEGISQWFWAAQALAEAGYVVMYATLPGNSAPTTLDATDWFTATPDDPTARGEFNPWHTRLDRSRLGIVGHSGAGLVALEVGHTDPRFDAVVAWDPAPIGGIEGITPRVPTMIHVADYEFAAQPSSEKPTPAPGSKYTFFDTISAAGIDTMQVAPRASTHIDWMRFTSIAALPHSIYGEMVVTYYTLAWLDRYVATPPGNQGSALARNAQRRLTASGTQPFDRSADTHSIGTGFFDTARAERAGNNEAGNVPIRLQGIPIRNLLSFHYDSRYFLDGGAQRCGDIRAGCPPP
jgi:dienelactone hydrolase